MDGITDSVDMSLSNSEEIVKDREDSHAALHGVAKSCTQLSNFTSNEYSGLVSFKTNSFDLLAV